MSAPSPSGNHFIVCGDGPLAYRIALELTSRYGEEVLVLLPDRTRNQGPQISAIPGVAVLERAELTTEAFAEAGVTTARAVALVSTDDVANFHAGLRAQELKPDVRLVLAGFNRRLGEHFRGLFADCTVLSSSATASPSFVAAALGQTTPSHVRVFSHTLYVARREDVDPGHVVCRLAVSDDPAGVTRLLPPESPAEDADLTIALADGTPRDPLRRHRLRAALAMAYRLAWNKYGIVFAFLMALGITGFALLLLVPKYSLTQVIYLGSMSLTGSALSDKAATGPEKFSQVLLTVDGMALIPVVTALIVGAQLTGRARGEPRPRGGHVIVVGLGNVGMRIVGELHDLGYGVAGVDRNPEAVGVALARRFGVPVTVGEANREETLRAAGVESAIALVSVTSSDIMNLETALQARAMREDLRIVLRLFDDDLAQRVQTGVGNVISRSVSYLAAPTFAAALLEHQVLDIMAVGRHVLLIADVKVAPGADIAGQAVTELESGAQARVLALQLRGAHTFDWSPHRGYLLVPGDRIIVLATRAGLGTFLAGNRPAVPSS